TRISLLRSRATAAFTSKILGGSVSECDLVVKGVVNGTPRGWLYTANDSYQSDRASEPLYGQAQLDAIADAGSALTYTCAPPGSGVRMGIDEDLDGVLDADERDAGTSPSNPGSLPGACSDGIDNDGDGLV